MQMANGCILLCPCLKVTKYKVNQDIEVAPYDELVKLPPLFSGFFFTCLHFFSRAPHQKQRMKCRTACLVLEGARLDGRGGKTRLDRENAFLLFIPPCPCRNVCVVVED